MDRLFPEPCWLEFNAGFLESSASAEEGGRERERKAATDGIRLSGPVLKYQEDFTKQPSKPLRL